jgi:signal recognition particle receptor subunit beta
VIFCAINPMPMRSSEPTPVLLETLKTALGLISSPGSLPQDLAAIGQSWSAQDLRIVVFGPFNYGKSTLLNAILGEKTLPIDLIPTTGAAITVRYGEQLNIKIHLVDGKTVASDNADVLKQFAILNEQRRMRSDVTAVDVYCPHPLLQLGVELVDLPGTDDQADQDRLVKTQLLSADLVVQVLDGRKLMTLQERENLRDWLLDRGITSVVFVANFLNLLEPEDQKQVMQRLRFVAESFRSRLPPNVSNLYRVDALPALRGRLQGDSAAVTVSGLPMLESALQAIGQHHAAITTAPDNRLPRLEIFAQQVQAALQLEIQALLSQPNANTDQQTRKLEIQRQAQQLLQKGFAQSAREVRDWLDLAHLSDLYQISGATALSQFDFAMWLTGLQLDWTVQQHKLTEWTDKAVEFFGQPTTARFVMQWPMEPQVIFPPAAPTSRDGGDSVAPVAIATGLGWVFGGPVGAAVLGGASYLLNKSRNPLAIGSDTSRFARVQQAYDQAMQNYLIQLNTLGLAAITQYEQQVRSVFFAELKAAPASPEPQRLGQLQACSRQIETELAALTA